MRPLVRNRIDPYKMARKVDVDHRIPLLNYYRIADNLLKQACIYREENNIIDLYVMLLRYSSLVLDTIKFHRDYQALCPKERAYCKKQILVVMDELESLKPEVDRQVDYINKGHKSEEYQPNGRGTAHRSGESSFHLPGVNNGVSFGSDNKQPGTDDFGCGYFIWNDEFQNKYFSQTSFSTQCSNCVAKDNKIDKQVNKIDKLETRNKMLVSQNKMLMTRIKTLEASLKLARNLEDHACQSGAMLHELLDDINNLHM